jgi:CheY-like chemotaxis protein
MMTDPFLKRQTILSERPDIRLRRLNLPRPEQLRSLVPDIQMPRMDGFELQRRLAEMNVSIPVVFVAANATGEEKRNAPKVLSQFWQSRPPAIRRSVRSD